MESAPTRRARCCAVCGFPGSCAPRLVCMALPRNLTPPRFAGWSPCFPPLRRAGVHARRTLAISKIGTLRRRRVRRDEGIPPYGHPGGRSRPGLVGRFGRFAGAGFTAPAGAFRRPTAAQRRLLGRRSRPQAFAPPRGSRDDASIVPYRGCNNAGPRPSRLAQNIKFIRRGGIYPARGTPHRRRVPGPIWNRPLQGGAVLCGLRFPE